MDTFIVKDADGDEIGTVTADTIARAKLKAEQKFRLTGGYYLRRVLAPENESDTEIALADPRTDVGTRAGLLRAEALVAHTKIDAVLRAYGWNLPDVARELLEETRDSLMDTLSKLD